MPIKLISLPYPEDALAPAISAETLRTHHGKHHKAYVTKTNDAVAGTALESAALEEIIAAASKDGDNTLFNNAAQAWNHGFYWHSLTPETQRPSAELEAAITRDFGSHQQLVEELQTRGAKHFASGWVWLATRGGTLSVEETHDGDTLAIGDKVPLLTIDLWEHAYYLDHKNERPSYLKEVIGTLLAWDFASANFANDECWRYPG